MLSHKDYKMNTTFMNSDNSKISNPHKLYLTLLPIKINLGIGEKWVELSNLSIYYTWNDIKNSYKKNVFKISAPTWNKIFEITDGSNSVSDIQDYFGYMIKNQEALTDNPSMKIYINKTENRVTFTTKWCYFDKLLMSVLRSTENKIPKDKNGEYALCLQITEVILWTKTNVANKDYL